MPLTIVQQLEALNGKADIDTITQLFNDIDPSICIKPYKDESNLLLIHNDFNSKNVTNIYKECRSFTLAIDNLVAKIVSYSHETFHNIDFVPVSDDIFEQMYEGTMITTFNYNNKWYFHTSRSTNIDTSYFLKSDNTFGNMFDDCLDA